MLTQTLICPKCGKEKPKTEFIDSVCLDCFFKNREFVNLKKNKLQICKGCGRLFYKNKWQVFSLDDLKEIVEENLKVDFDNYDLEDIFFDIYPEMITANIKIKGTIGNHSVESNRKLNISLTRQYCEDCYKSLSNYFQATLQIRFSKDDEKYKTIKKDILKILNSIVKEERKKGDFLAFVEKIADVKNGFDIYLGSKTLAFAVIRVLKSKYTYERKDSTTLIGMDKKGKNKIRYTYLIRLL